MIRYGRKPSGRFCQEPAMSRCPQGPLSPGGQCQCLRCLPGQTVVAVLRIEARLQPLQRLCIQLGDARLADAELVGNVAEPAPFEMVAADDLCLAGWQG